MDWHKKSLRPQKGYGLALLRGYVEMDVLFCYWMMWALFLLCVDYKPSKSRFLVTL